jgi:AcrR family transcriptional regulator
VDQRPRGAEQVRSALLSAAGRHFAAEGPNASLRDIADDAQVNIGLIHHYFGNKADLLGAVMTDIVDRAQRGAQPFTTFDQALEFLLQSVPEGGSGDPDSGDYIRIVAWLLLAGQDPRDYQRDFSLPAVAELADGEGRGLLLLLLTATFGWGIFGAHLSSLVGYESQADAARDFIEALRGVTASRPAARRR